MSATETTTPYSLLTPNWGEILHTSTHLQYTREERYKSEYIQGHNTQSRYEAMQYFKMSLNFFVQH